MNLKHELFKMKIALMLGAMIEEIKTIPENKRLFDMLGKMLKFVKEDMNGKGKDAPAIRSVNCAGQAVRGQGDHIVVSSP